MRRKGTAHGSRHKVHGKDEGLLTTRFARDTEGTEEIIYDYS